MIAVRGSLFLLVVWCACGLAQHGHRTTCKYIGDVACGNNGNDAQCAQKCQNLNDPDGDLEGGGWFDGACHDLNDDGSKRECVCVAEAHGGSASCDPAYSTFDGAWYSSQSLCRHVLAETKPNYKHDKFTVYGTNQCFHESKDGNCHSAFMKKVELEIFGQHVVVDIEPRRERKVYLNGEHILGDHKWAGSGTQRIHIERYMRYGWFSRYFGDCSDCLAVKIWASNGVGITVYDLAYYVRVVLPKTHEFLGQVSGAMGLFDGDYSNDFSLPRNKGLFNPLHPYSNNRYLYYTDGERFMESWATDKTCRTKNLPKKCRPPVQKLADEKCALNATNGVFADCFDGPYRLPSWIDLYRPGGRLSHLPWAARRVAYFESEQYQINIKNSLLWNARWFGGRCSQDVCGIDNPSSAVDNGACDALTWFTNTCRYYKPDAKIGEYRTKKFCPLECPANAEFSQCAGCQKTCSDNKGGKSMKDCECSEGCVCRRGHILDEKTGKCVKRNQCS